MISVIQRTFHLFTSRFSSGLVLLVCIKGFKR